METLKIILTIIQLVSGLAVTVVVLMQSGKSAGLSGAIAGGAETFLVGVHSYGPDGKTGGDNSWDDISTMPEEIVK